MENFETNAPPEARKNLQSFILRCWMNADGVQRFRLINARTGQESLFQDTEQLTQSIKAIIERAPNLVDQSTAKGKETNHENPSTNS